MFATNHVLVGALLGRVIRRPAAAAAAGVVSHVAMDALPHWGMDVAAPGGRRRFLLIAATDGVLLTAVLKTLVRRRRPASEIAGALGGLLLDLDKPAAELGIRQLWPDLVHHVHIDIQKLEAPQRWRVDAAVALIASALLIATASHCD
jgi:hypothetical protein